MWKSFLLDLWSRLVTPWSKPPFFFFFVINIVICGSAGVLITLGHYWFISDYPLLNIPKALSTYFIAILATSAADLNLKDNNFPKSSSLLSYLILVIGIFLILLTFLFKSNAAFITSGIGTILAYLVWIIANSKDSKFEEKTYDTVIREDSKRKKIGKNWN
jgi:hypothetical protein